MAHPYVGSVVTITLENRSPHAYGAARVKKVEGLQFVLQPHDSGVLALNRESRLNFGDKAPVCSPAGARNRNGKRAFQNGVTTLSCDHLVLHQSPTAPESHAETLRLVLEQTLKVVLLAVEGVMSEKFPEARGFALLDLAIKVAAGEPRRDSAKIPNECGWRDINALAEATPSASPRKAHAHLGEPIRTR